MFLSTALILKTGGGNQIHGRFLIGKNCVGANGLQGVFDAEYGQLAAMLIGRGFDVTIFDRLLDGRDIIEANDSDGFVGCCRFHCR